MAEVVVTGAGLGGLLTALVLAGDGHRVTVIERDAHPPPDDPVGAWGEWQRRGVAQFRQLFYLLPRFRALVEAELPELGASLGAVALRHQPMADVAIVEESDAAIVALTARRPTVEAVVARVAARHPLIDVRRGVAVVGLLVGEPRHGAVPHVVGVRTGDGPHPADLVVDAAGRRTPLGGWLTAIGARPFPEVVEDSGFVYHSRHFHNPDGRVPAMRGPLLQHFGSLSVLTLPAEAGTWGVGLITSSRDQELRSLHRPESWTALLNTLAPVAHWAQGTPITGIDVMTRLEDRRRTLCPDGQPIVTGVVPIADSWASTNPTLGRGTTLALLHAIELRDTLRAVGLAEPIRFSQAWHDVTERKLGPEYDAVITADRNRLAEIDAAIEGRPYDGGDVAWRAYRMLEDVAHLDPDLLRGWFRIAGLVASGTEVFSQDGFIRRVARAARHHVPATPVPTRDQLIAVARDAPGNT